MPSVVDWESPSLRRATQPSGPRVVLGSGRQCLACVSGTCGDNRWSGGTMPREPMKSRVVRVPDDLWKRAQERAAERGEHLSEAIRKFLERYAR